LGLCRLRLADWKHRTPGATAPGNADPTRIGGALEHRGSEMTRSIRRADARAAIDGTRGPRSRGWH